MDKHSIQVEHPELHVALAARQLDADKLHHNLSLAGFSWQQILQILQAILTAVAPVLPPTPPKTA